MNKKNAALLLYLVLLILVSGCSRSRISKGADVEDKEQRIQGVKKEISAPLGKLLPGEILTYKVTWLGMNVGNATLEIRDMERTVDNKEVCHVVLRAWTNKFFSFFYNVDGTIESFVDANTFKPIRYNSETHINKKFVFKKMEYDFKKGKVYAQDKKGEYEIAITEKTLDPLGVFYYFRKNPVVLNKAVAIVVNGGKKNFPVEIYARRQHFIKIPAGRFWAFQIEPTPESERQFDDSLNAEGSMRIWFSADERRIPLLIALKVPVGTAQAVLVKMELPES